MIYLIEISIFTFLSSWIDYEHLKDNNYIESHLSRVLLRSLFIYVASEGNNQVLFGMALFFASTFDNTLNLMRGKELFKLGKTAWWDRFWSKIKPVYIFFVLSGIPISIYILLTN